MHAACDKDCEIHSKITGLDLRQRPNHYPDLACRLIYMTWIMSRKMSKTCILVLGTHRSGTSAFSRLLNLSGAAAPKTLMPPQDDNERGFWESEIVAGLNDVLLAACGSAWDDWRAFNAEDHLAEYGPDLVKLIAAAIQSEYDDAETIVLKDPRISRFVPLYVEALDRLGYEAAFLHSLRDPRAVAASLAARNKTPPEQAGLLWMRHHLDAEVATRGHRRAFFSYEDLIRDWRPQVRRMRTAFSLPPAAGNDTYADKIEEFLSPRLQHHLGDTPFEGVDEETAARIDDVAGLLMRLRFNPSDPTAMTGLDDAQPFLERMSAREEKAQCDLSAERGSELSALRAETTRLRSQIALGKGLRSLQDTEIGKLNREIGYLRDERMHLRFRLSASEARAGEAFELAREFEQGLRMTRKRPLSALRQLLKYRLLRTLSKDGWPLPGRTKRRFGESAAKVSPKRSQLDRRLDALATPFRGADDVTGSEASVRSMDALKAEVRADVDRDLAVFLASNARIRFSHADEPRVSIILVLWNQAGLTLRCLRSLEAETDLPFEVILIDNASTDRTSELLERIDNVRLISHDKNIGFLKAVNRGLEAVRSGHVLLLNNDAVVRPGSIAAAVEAMEADGDVGAVGGPIILPDGTLQEAGSIIWADGDCLGYGRGDDPSDGAYNFRREVDYCSGAFLLIREGVFQRLGGFDPDFAPAYYEETDLCMRIRHAGMKVIFEPRAVIDHFEFGSSENTERAIELQKINRQKFLRKHSSQLRNHLSPLATTPLLARMRGDCERILYIEDRIPIVSLGAGLPRSNSILRLMVEEGYFVTFFPSIVPYEDWTVARSGVPEGVEVAMGWGPAGLEKFLEERKGYYQHIFISRPHNMEALSDVYRQRPDLFEGTKVTYDAEALFSSRTAIKAEILGDKALAAKAKHDKSRELALAETADQITAVTEKEAEVFRHATGKPTHVISYALDTGPTPAAFALRKDIVFLGRLEEEDSPNVDSLTWYAENVMPLLALSPESDAPLKVAGHSGAASIRALETDSIKLLGPVDDLHPLFNQARVFVAPTRFAAGIPLKVHHAAASGVPVVATSVLASQLGWRDEEEILVADTPQAFADAVYRLYTDEALWNRVRRNALRRISEDYSVERFQASLRETLSSAHQTGI